MYNPPHNFHGGYRPQNVPESVPKYHFNSDFAPNNSAHVYYEAVNRVKRQVADFQPTAAIFNVPLVGDTPGQLPTAYGTHVYVKHTISKHNEEAAHRPQQFTGTTQLSFGGYAPRC